MSSNTSARSLSAIIQQPHESIELPNYNMDDVKIGVVHLGCGAFHRAHQALYFDNILKSGDLSWGLCSVSWNSAVTRDNLAKQDNIYTVYTSDPSAPPRIVGAIREMLVAPENPEAVLARMADPATKLITLTITQKGYCCNMSDRALSLNDAGVRNDLRNPEHPQTAIGYMVEALARRKAAGLPGLTILSCDNIPENGNLTAKLVHDMAEARDPALAAWIDEKVTFPNSMVDRITPSFEEKHRKFLKDTHGIVCHAPVFTEAFNQWVIEDKFAPNTKPPLDQFGIQFVDDVKPFELMKLRLLNGTHMAIAYLGMLAGFTKVDQLMANEGFSRFVGKFLDEVAETIPEIPGFNTAAYKVSVFKRLSSMDDPVNRLGRDGSTKLQGRILPSVTDALEKGTGINAMAYAVAGWMRYVVGQNDKGMDYDIVDPNKDRLREIARLHREDPSGLLGEQAIFGNELPNDAKFTMALGNALKNIYAKGALKAIETLDNSGATIISLSSVLLLSSEKPSGKLSLG